MCPPLVADFLLYLRQEKNLRAGTIKAYKSAVASVVDTQEPLIGSDRALHRLLRSFQLEDLKKPHIFPKWDLCLVLKSLNQAPNEPMESAPL